MTAKENTAATEQNTDTTTAKTKTLGGVVGDFVADHVLKIPKKPLEERIANLNREQKHQLHEIEERTVANFHGQLDELESALGMLRLGYHFGWKVLYLIHSKRTIRKYEGILDIRVREIFPETGPGSYRSYGLILAEKFSNFWKVAGGDIKIPDRKKVD